MVEGMDEAAVYGSPMYHLLEEEFSTGRPASEDSELSDSRREDAKPATGEAKTTASKPAAADGGTAGDETDDNVDFDRAWELFGNGEIDARRVLAVLTRIHGEGTNDWWPLVRAAIPPGKVSSSLAREYA